MSKSQSILREYPIVGLNLDIDPMSFKDGEYSYMLNGCLFDTSGKAPFARMYKGNRLVCSIPFGYVYNGSVNIAQDETCLFLVNPSTGESEIGLFDGVHYNTVVSDVRLGFRINKQIQAIYYKDFNGQKIIMWVSEGSPIRYMNLTEPPLLNGSLDIDALNVFKKYQYPQLRVSEIVSGGRLLAGSYYLSLQYADENGNGLTSWSTPVGPVHIFRDSITQPRDYINGSPDREATDKAIKIELSNLDKSFKYVNVGVIKSYQGIRSGVKAATISVEQNSYLYTGLVDTETDVDLKEMLTPGVSYSSAKTIAMVNGTCVIGNLRGPKEYNLQPYISKIRLLWQVVRERYDGADDSYANSLNSLYKLIFRRNEVYDFAIVIRWLDGTKSRAYPLIPRKKNCLSDGSTISNTVDSYGNSVSGGWDSGPVVLNDDVFESGNSVPERYKVFNTALVLGDDLGSNNEGAHLYGEFGYYEATDSWPTNSDVWGDNAGQPIRRFKMPDFAQAPLTSSINTFYDEKEIPYVNRLGIRFANIEDVMNSLPDEIKSQVAGWELVRADRRQSKSVIGSGLIFNSWYQNWTDRSNIIGGSFFGNPIQEPDDVRLYPNYPLNDLRPDYFIKKVPIGSEGPFPDNSSNDRYKKDIFTFVSPDTSFNRNLLFAGELLIHGEVYGVAKNTISYLRPYPQLKDRGDDSYLSAYLNLTLGYYNNWKMSKPGNLRRQVKEAMYIPFNSQVGTGVVGLPMQNVTRESSVLLATGKTIENPTIVDTSRALLTDSERNCRFSANVLYRTTSAYYVSLISRIANQYGSVYDPRYMFTNYDNSNISNNTVIFGGDTYIAPFSIKRQLATYQNAEAFKNWEDGSNGIDLKNSFTIAGTRYYYEAIRRNANKDSLTECEPGTNRLGKLPLIFAGIPIFFCESDYNIDLRLNGSGDSETFYPNLKDGSVKVEDWVGIENIEKDNDYSMNPSYNEQNDLYGYQNVDPFYNPNKDVQTEYSTRAIKSLERSPENRFNNLLVFLPLNYYDFPNSDGPLEDIRDVGNYRVLFRMRHAFYVSNLYDSVETNQGKLVLGNGRLFNSLPVRISKADSGYSGTSEQWAFNNTPFGAFCVDSKRHSVFVYGESLNDISANDASSWLSANMGFRLLTDIPGFPNIDNPSNPEGIGYHSVWDSGNKLYLLTKIDYELKDKSIATHFSIVNGQLYLNGGPVSLRNEKYFINRSWTFGYSPLTKKWVSWYSFKPESYFEMGNKFYSLQSGDIYCYDNPNPRTYFGKRYPFEIEFVTKVGENRMFHTSQVMTRSFPILNGILQGESTTETFNKAHFYNTHQSTGLRHLIYQDENDLSQILRKPVTTPFYAESFIRRDNLIWNVNELYDMVKDPSLPFIEPWPNDVIHSNIDYSRDYKESAILRDAWAKHRFIYDKEADIQMAVYTLLSLSDISYK